MTTDLKWNLVLFDAANNCIRHNAVAVITLKGSGVQYEGKINKGFLVTYSDTVTLEQDGGGTVAIDRDDIAAVETKHGRA